MAAYRRVCDSRHLQADCQGPGSAPEPYARQSSMGYLYLFYLPHYFADWFVGVVSQVAEHPEQDDPGEAAENDAAGG